MKFYPVRVPRDCYRGRQPNRLKKQAEFNRVAHRVEEYLNNDLAPQPDNIVRVYYSHLISTKLGEDYDLVADIVFGIDCGSGGVTICKGNLDTAWAGIVACSSR